MNNSVEPPDLATSLPTEGLCLRAERGRVRLQLRALPVGSDLCLILDGGDRPHVGALVVAAVGETTRTVERLGHREALLAQELAMLAVERLQRPVAVVCGIHLDEITTKEINEILALSRQLTDELLESLVFGLSKDPRA